MAGNNVAAITLVGYVGNDPDAKYLESGVAATSFSIGVTLSYRKDDDHTAWYRISTIGKLAEVCNQYVTRGMLVYISGQLLPREYTTQDGQNRTALDVRAETVRFLSRKDDTDHDDGDRVVPGTELHKQATVTPDDDIPF